MSWSPVWDVVVIVCVVFGLIAIFQSSEPKL